MDKMQLATYASFVLNRTVTQREAAAAAGYKSRNSFAVMDNPGELPLERIQRACEHWGINPNDAMIAMGYLTHPEDWTLDARAGGGKGKAGIRERMKEATLKRINAQSETGTYDPNYPI